MLIRAAKRLLHPCCLIVVFALSALTSGSAQTDTGRIAGTVRDVNGAIVTGVTVTVRDERTNEERTTTTTDEGLFIVPALRASTYTVTATASGFTETRVSRVQLNTAQNLTLDLVLQPAGVSGGTVTVTAANESALDTGSARIGASVNEREVEELPLNGRQLSQLYLQAPGSTNAGTGTFNDIRFSGRSNEQNIIRYDGIEGTAIIDTSPGNLNGEVPSPFRLQTSLENVQEFRVDSNNYTAEFGTGTGGQVSVTTKSGSNNFHGSAFEYVRNDRFDARNFFDLARKAPLRLNQFGGSVGGAIKKDKAFFFFSYEGYRLRAGINTIEAAPSLRFAQPGALIPGTTTPVNPNVQPLIAAFRGAGSVVLGSPTPDFDLVQLQGTSVVDENAFGLRLDYRFNDRFSIYGRYFRDQGRNIQPEGVTGRQVLIRDVPQNAVVSLQQVYSPSLINETKIGFNEALSRINGIAPTVNGIDLSSLTINIAGQVANAGIAGQTGNSGVAIPGGLVRQNSATNGRGAPYTPYSLSFIDNLNYIRGNHNTKFGGEIRPLRLYTDRQGGTTYTYSNLASFLANTAQSVQFLGDVSAPNPFTSQTGSRLLKQTYYIAYGQDEWKIRPNLTFYYGLRYEYYTPLREARNLNYIFDTSGASFNINQCLNDINNCNRLDPSTDFYKSKKNNFGPRLAITYAPNYKAGFFGGGRTVLRGGFGIYFGPGQTEDQLQPVESLRVNRTLSNVANAFSTDPASPTSIASINAGFANNPGRSYQPRAYARDYSIPERVYQYSFSIQQELPYNMTATIGYVGSQGRNLFLRGITNLILPGNAVIPSGAPLPAGVGVINVTNASGQVIGVTTVRQFDILGYRFANGQVLADPTSRLTPFAEIDFKTSGGRDEYDALQASLTRRFTSGLTLNAQYTFSRSIGNTQGSNEARTAAVPNNFDADYGPNIFDIPHSFNLSAVYDLPIGRGRRFLSDASRLTNALVGGFQIGGIFNARSGLPIEVLITRPDLVMVCNAPSCALVGQSVPQGFVAALPGTINAANPLPTGFIAVINTPGGGASRAVRRPDLIAGVNPYLNNDRNLLNPAAFAIPRPGTYGNLGRDALRGPSFNQFDLVVAKRIALAETANIELRAEFFNLFNTTNFANPSATLGNAITGTSSSLQPGQPFSSATAGSTFGLLTSTVGRTVGLGTNRQIQFAVRFNF
jgi:hypothetical protein